MIYFDRHSLEVLEYPKIIGILKGFCLTPYGIAKLDYYHPRTDLTSIQNRMNEIAEMVDIIRFGDPFPLTRQKDCIPLIHSAKTTGATLEPRQLLAIKELIKASEVQWEGLEMPTSNMSNLSGFDPQQGGFQESKNKKKYYP